MSAPLTLPALVQHSIQNGPHRNKEEEEEEEKGKCYCSVLPAN